MAAAYYHKALARSMAVGYERVAQTSAFGDAAFVRKPTCELRALRAKRGSAESLLVRLCGLRA